MRPRAWARWRRLHGMVGAVMLTLVCWPNSSMLTTAQANTINYTHISGRLGFDACQTPDAATMQAWWTYSPYYDVNIYFAGPNRSCNYNPSLNPTTLSTIENQGWALI